MQTPLPPPIPDPRETELRRAEPEYSATFRARFLPLFLGYSILGLVVWYFILWPVTSANRPAKVFDETVKDLIFLFVFTICVTLTVAFLIKVRVTETSLYGTNAWGIPTEIMWDDITEVRRSNFCGLRYLKLSTRERENVLWLPLFLSKMPKFKSLVALHTTADNPLAKVLNETR